MAPAATLVLYCITDRVTFRAAEQDIEAAGDIKIVTSSLGFLGDSRGDGSGVVDGGSDLTTATTVKTARQAGILWIQSAGNNGEDHWGGTFADVNPHDGFADSQSDSRPKPSRL